MRWPATFSAKLLRCPPIRCLPWLDEGPLVVAPGNERGELQIVAAVERQFDDRAVLDDRADRGVLGLQQRRAALDVHDLGQLAHLHRHGDAGGAPDLDLDVLPLDGPETGERRLEGVGAGLNRRHHVEARLVGLDLAHGVGRLVGKVTVTPGMAAPLASEIKPLISPDGVWAYSEGAMEPTKRTAANSLMTMGSPFTGWHITRHATPWPCEPRAYWTPERGSVNWNGAF